MQKISTLNGGAYLLKWNPRDGRDGYDGLG